MQKIIPVPHYAQFIDVDDPKWKERSCAIISLAMILSYHGKEIDVKEAIEKGLKIKVKDPVDGIVGGHDPKFGWRHDAIVGLAKHYGFDAYRTEDDLLENLLEALVSDEPVIVNIYKNFDPKEGGHLAVLTGYFELSGQIVSLFVNDPIGIPYKYKNKGIPLEIFENGWKKRAIYIKKVK